MRKWSRSLFVTAILATLLPTASAAAYNRQLTVYASVLPVRALYINSDGDLAKVGGNTADNIEPRVFDLHNQPVPLTETVKNQYEQVLKANSGHLIAGKIYTYNPVVVITAPNTLSINL